MKNYTQSLRDIQHFGEEGGVVPAIDVSATSTFLNPSDMEKAFQGEITGCYLYSRHSNPTVKAFGAKLAALEGMEAGLGVASGMAAVYATIRQLMPEGGHLICSRTIYGGTYALFKNIFPKIGIDVTFIDIEDSKNLTDVIRENTKVFYTETMSNPLLRMADLPKLIPLCHQYKIKVVIDNTFTPVLVRPAQWGADVVIHSCTKYISGASDLIAGAIVGSQDFINQLIDINHGMVMLTGPVMDTHVAHNLYMRLDHLPIRMAAHSKMALSFATRFFEEKIPVIYPGLKTHPDFSLNQTMINTDFGFGGMLVVDCKTPEKALALANKLQQEKFGLYAVSLGFSRTLMSCPSMSTSSEIPAGEQTQMGLSPGLLRLSIGYLGDQEIMAHRFIESYRSVITDR